MKQIYIEKNGTIVVPELPPVKPELSIESVSESLDFGGKLENIVRRTKRNSLLSFYYEQFAIDYHFNCLPDFIINSSFFRKDVLGLNFDKLVAKSKAIRDCCSYWDVEHYRELGIKDVISTNLCRDRFCDNCQNTLSWQRSEKYTPVLLKLAEEYVIDHVILTVPNVHIEELSTCLDKMFNAYKRLCLFLDGRKKVRNVDYSVAGYLGSIRALEITRNSDLDTYHPHFHCLWLRKKGTKALTKGSHVNRYSFKAFNGHLSNKYKNEPRRFSDFEVLLQKTWRLLYDGVELTKDNLDALPIGYSCQMSSACGRYKEVFKYATKGLLSSDPGQNPTDNYNAFVLLFCILHGRRLVQSYGCLYRMTFNDDIDYTSSDKLYAQIKADLNAKEHPISRTESLSYMVESSNKKICTYISKRSLGSLAKKDFYNEP